MFDAQISGIKQLIRLLADEGIYEFKMYLQMNPKLEPSLFINLPHPLSDTSIKFRLRSHKLSIETGHLN